jgi:hypothetical protein
MWSRSFSARLARRGDSATTLLPRAFSAGRGALPCFNPWPCPRAAALYPAGWCSCRSLSRAPLAFAETETARHPDCTSRGLHWAFTRRCGPRARSPCLAGLCRWASPAGSPAPAPPKLCGFDLLPLRDSHPMDPWVPPGITQFKMAKDRGNRAATFDRRLMARGRGLSLSSAPDDGLDGRLGEIDRVIAEKLSSVR